MPRRVHCALAALTATLLTACSPGSGPRTVPEQPATPAGQPGGQHDHHPEGQAIGISPGGVTTRVDEDDQPGDPLAEPAKKTEKEVAAPLVEKKTSSKEKKSPKKVKKRKKSGKKKPKKKDAKKKD